MSTARVRQAESSWNEELPEPPRVELRPRQSSRRGNDLGGQAVGLEPRPGRGGQREAIEEGDEPIEPEVMSRPEGAQALGKHLGQAAEPDGAGGEGARPGIAAGVESQVECVVQGAFQVREDLAEHRPAFLGRDGGQLDVEQRPGITQRNARVLLAAVEPRHLFRRQLAPGPRLVEPAAYAERAILLCGRAA